MLNTEEISRMREELLTIKAQQDAAEALASIVAALGGEIRVPFRFHRDRYTLTRSVDTSSGDYIYRAEKVR